MPSKRSVFSNSDDNNSSDEEDPSKSRMEIKEETAAKRPLHFVQQE